MADVPVRREETTPSHALTTIEEMDRFFERMEQAFEDFFPRGWLTPFRWQRPWWRRVLPPIEARLPNMDLIDRDEEVVVRAELPGVEKDKLDVSLTDNALTVRGSTGYEEKEEKGDYYRCEIGRGAFSRTIPLPAAVDSEKAKAKFQNGVLEITLPKVEKAKRRTVKVE
ncbi:Hsp20/alpha crystallin family protein [Methylocaldum szegediense]|jgi:HSP20 family protein|uniref:HSP20 family protein n=1 Tax=Methylocaldum szegediense TaxID=73780 RepID=A0ABN8X284_9GAMM|nr:Hsp20/alpha crystallin family protein [Methylocaldum szegediense]CAI8819464.1 HSP20 family protein [Methylocaldum szegediense]